jgi:hypothetical protein
MANDFSTDPSCKALWRFEPGALAADSRGNNTLTLVNNPISSTLDFREGSGCVDLEFDNGQYFRIADAALDLGFPLKSGDAIKKITVCCWVKPESFGSYRRIWSKYDYPGNKKSLTLWVSSSGTVTVEWGYGTGSSSESFSTGITLATGTWYHIGVVADGVNRLLTVRVYNASTQAVSAYNATPNNVLWVGDVEWRIGAPSGEAWYWDGLIDEMVVFNALKSVLDLDKIRAGAYTGVGAVDVLQVLGHVEYQVPPLIKTTQSLAQVEYSIPPLIKVPQVIGQVEYREFDPGLYVKQFVVQVEYQEIPPMTHRRKFPVPDSRTSWQSQAGRRKFPVVG